MKYPLPGAFATLALLFAAPPAFGQSALRPSPKSEAPPITATVVEEPAEKRFDIDLTGGTAEAAVKHLTEKIGYPINVIFTGDSASFELPKLQLRKVTVNEVFAAVKAAGIAEQKNGRPGCEFVPVEGASNIYTFSVTQPRHNYTAKYGAPAAGPLVASQVVPWGTTSSQAAEIASNLEKAHSDLVRTANTNPAAAAQWAAAQWPGTTVMMAPGKAPQKSTLFFDLSKVLDKTLTIEDVTTAIRTGWAAAADGKEPAPEALKFHQESKLLIATGPPEHLEAVTNIVRLLEARNLPSKDEQTRNIEGLRLRIEEASEQNDRLQAKLADDEKLKDAQVRELRDQIARLEIELAKRTKSQ